MVTKINNHDYCDRKTNTETVLYINNEGGSCNFPVFVQWTENKH